MPPGPVPSADELRQVASAIGLELSADEIESSLDPVASILGSMEPLEEPPAADETTPTVRPVDREDPHNAFITAFEVPPSRADGPLAGTDVAIKDNIAVAGVELTAGSAVLEGCVPTRNAPVVARLLDAGARLVGKTNMDEFAFGPTGETSHFGPTTNPRDSDYTPGGSSSGSAAAVASAAADLALGTDTGGSVRIPASYTGVIGVKPTRGSIPTAGVVELAGSLDTVGVLGTDLGLVATGLDVLADGSATGATGAIDPGELTIGLPGPLFEDPVATRVADQVRTVVDGLADRGAMTEPVEYPGTGLSSAAWRAITMSELYCYIRDGGRPYRLQAGESYGFESVLGDARTGRLDRLSTPLKQYLLIGGHLVTRDGGRTYDRARAVQTWLTRTVDAAFETVDVLVAPTTPTTAYRFGEFSRDTSPPINRNTHPFNLTGHPAISLPCGEVEGLPVGLQLVTPAGTEARLFQVARTVLDGLGN